MEKEELLRRLEDRLARGEIGEKTYLDIKARYDAMPDVPTAPETPASPEPPIPPVPPVPPVSPLGPDSPRHAGHAGHPPFRNGDMAEMIERTVESAMEQVAVSLEAAFGNKEEARRRMDEVSKRMREAMSAVGPRIEESGRTCVIRGSGTVAGGQHFG